MQYVASRINKRAARPDHPSRGGRALINYGNPALHYVLADICWTGQVSSIPDS